MKFGEIAVADAEGAILAHSRQIEIDGKRKRVAKGTALTAAHIAGLEAEGVATIIAATLGPGDIGEDEAAGQIAAAASGAHVRAAAAFTGRANLMADAAGIVLIDAERIAAANAVHESITIATLRPFDDVSAGQMLATVKIIPFAAPAAAVAAALECLKGGAAVRVARFSERRVGLLSTMLPGQKPSLADKARKIMEARLQKSGSTLVADRRCDHEPADVADDLAALRAAGADLLVAFSASAVVDRDDVVPAGVVAAGGELHHLGMPVDPGNLLLLGALEGVPVLGAPSCARSPKLNGFDWVFDRLVAGLDVGPAEIAAMGVGGLLKEIASRPQPRAGRPAAGPRRAPRITALLLAAGQSRRMGKRNKLTVDFRGRPLVRWAADAALASSASDLVVVTGHDGEAVRAALDGTGARFVENADFAGGLSTSLAAGLANIDAEADGVLVMLGDMPAIGAMDIDRLIAAFDPDEGRSIVVPMVSGKRGNPVLWAHEFLPELSSLHGDTGARHLIGEYADAVAEVELGDAALADVDTEEALATMLAEGEGAADQGDDN